MKLMFRKFFSKGRSLKEEGVPASTAATPDMTEAIVEIFLAQADSLRRLGRTNDVERKLAIARATALECHHGSPKSAIAWLIGARVARAGGQFDLAESMLNAAANFGPTDHELHNIEYERSQIRRERDIAGGNAVVMAQRLIIYTCQRCGCLVEFITVPCMRCSWIPTTAREMAISVRLSIGNWTISELVGIGRAIMLGREITDVVPNISDVAEQHIKDPASFDYRLVNQNMALIDQKRHDSHYAWPSATTCAHCGQQSPMNWWLTACDKCGKNLTWSPPLRLMSALTRLVIHIQQNYKSPSDHDPQSTEYHMFLCYLVMLQSKLYRLQDTPSEEERTQFIERLSAVHEFVSTGRLWAVEVAKPSAITKRPLETDETETQQNDLGVVEDFVSCLRYVVGWMKRRKALC
ncbi:MAG: tetratricopeptide repeat protein [Acidiferrobacteraceae bacterium]